jgi:hypothetical protein
MGLSTVITTGAQPHLAAAGAGFSSPATSSSIESEIEPSQAHGGTSVLGHRREQSSLHEVARSPQPDFSGGTLRYGTKAAEELEARLAALTMMDAEHLRAEWRRLYRALPPSRLGRELLLLGVACKLQEQVHGGLSAGSTRRLAELATTMSDGGDLVRSRAVRLRQGAKLVREWHGETVTVLVLEDGFEWQGNRWRSLSRIAREITGTRWSGPRFFGMEKAKHRANTDLKPLANADQANDA